MRTIILTIILLAACEINYNPGEETSNATTVNPNITSGDESTTSGDSSTGNASMSTSDAASTSDTTSTPSDSSTTNTDCTPVAEQPNPYGRCESTCEGECSDGRACVFDEFGGSLSTCSDACIIVDECPPSTDPLVSPVCQLGQCFLACSVKGECPAGYECFDPGLVGYASVCLAS